MAKRTKQQIGKTAEEAKPSSKQRKHVHKTTQTDSSSETEMSSTKMMKKIEQPRMSSEAASPMNKKRRIIETDLSDSSDDEECEISDLDFCLPTKKSKINDTVSNSNERDVLEEKATMFVTAPNGEELVLFKSGYSPLSNFYPMATFKIDGQEYNSVCKWIAASKARYCDDKEALEKILKTKSSGYAKIMENKIAANKKWLKGAYAVTIRGIEEKFKQNKNLQDLLLKTGSATIAEANEWNSFWTIGVDIDDYDSHNKKKWCGKNMMGKALMRIRNEI